MLINPKIIGSGLPVIKKFKIVGVEAVSRFMLGFAVQRYGRGFAYGLLKPQNPKLDPGYLLKWSDEKVDFHRGESELKLVRTIYLI